MRRVRVIGPLLTALWGVAGMVGNLYAQAPAPVGYDPAIIPAWADGPLSDAFAVLRLVPWRLRVQPGSLMGGGEGELLVWSDGPPDAP